MNRELKSILNTGMRNATKAVRATVEDNLLPIVARLEALETDLDDRANEAEYDGQAARAEKLGSQLDEVGEAVALVDAGIAELLAVLTELDQTGENL